MYRALERSLGIASTGPQNLLHGDSDIGNTYVTAAGRMGFTDWQVVLRGSWAYDFAYVVASGLAVADRRAWERELLTGYLERLTACGAPAPDFDAAWLAYRRQALYPYFIWLSTIRATAMRQHAPGHRNGGTSDVRERRCTGSTSVQKPGCGGRISHDFEPDVRVEGTQIVGVRGDDGAGASEPHG